MHNYMFRRSKLDEISIWLPLLLKCIEKNQTFKIVFNEETVFEFVFHNKHFFEKISFYFTSQELKLSSSSRYKYNQKEYHFTVKGKQDIFRFYYFINETLTKDNLSEKLLKKIEEESKKEGKLRSNERYNYFKLSSLFCARISFGCLNNSFKLISPVDSPDSNKVIGRIFIHAKRPVPL